MIDRCRSDALQDLINNQEFIILMHTQNYCVKGRPQNSAKKDSSTCSAKSSPDDKHSSQALQLQQFLMQQQQQLQMSQNYSPGQETIVVTVIPCGREDGKNSDDEMPFELKIKKKTNEHSLKEIFARKSELWERIFKQHLDHESVPNFSIYRKPFEYEQDPSKSDLFLHILYMKSSEKALTRNYNAQELELFCHNRFYGPLVVAYNLNKTPYFLCSFALQDLHNIELINRNFQNKSIKDDYVPDCLTDFFPLRQDLDSLYKRGTMEIFTFYMFKYKSSWCPNKKDSHDSKSCIYAHHTRDFRRPPDIFKYLPEDCETLIKGIGWDKCDKGLKCNKCHTTVERLYHPDKYKRIFCDKSRCNNSEICAFNHSQKEKQQALKECKNYRRQVDLKNLPDVTELSDQLLDFYKVQIQLAQLQTHTGPSAHSHSSHPHSHSASLKSSLIEPDGSCAKEQASDSVIDSSSSSSKSQPQYDLHQFDSNSDVFQIQIQNPTEIHQQLAQSQIQNSQSMLINHAYSQIQALSNLSFAQAKQNENSSPQQSHYQNGLTRGMILNKVNGQQQHPGLMPQPLMNPNYDYMNLQSHHQMPQQQNSSPAVLHMQQPHIQQIGANANGLYYNPMQQQFPQQPQQMLQPHLLQIHNINLMQHQYQHISPQQMMLQQQQYLQNPQQQLQQMPIGQPQTYLMPQQAPQFTPNPQNVSSHNNSPTQMPPMVNNMHQIQLISANPYQGVPQMQSAQTQDDSQTLSQNFTTQGSNQSAPPSKMQVNFFDYSELDEMKTRNSTFSKASDGREEIKRNCVSFLEKAFVQESSMAFLNPVDDEDAANLLMSSPNGGVGALARQPSGKSPSNFASPIILDFLEDDNFFQVEESRTKSKTEFLRRDRQESQDSCLQEDYQLIGDAQDYLNSILPNNSFKFKRSTQSRFSFSNTKRR